MKGIGEGIAFAGLAICAHCAVSSFITSVAWPLMGYELKQRLHEQYGAIC